MEKRTLPSPLAEPARGAGENPTTPTMDADAPDDIA
jgi:hypothetical protein